MTFNDNEAQWVRRASAGDMQAFAALVEAHQQFVFNLALRATNHYEEAEDLAQEALIRAWRHIADFRGESGFRTWLYRILMNLVYDRYPRFKRDLAALSLEDNEMDIAEQPFVEQNCEQSELRQVIHQNMQQLAPTYRTVLMLRFQQELSYQEIAEIMDIPMGTVKTSIYRAKAQLKTALQANREVRAWME